MTSLCAFRKALHGGLIIVLYLSVTGLPGCSSEKDQVNELLKSIATNISYTESLQPLAMLSRSRNLDKFFAESLEVTARGAEDTEAAFCGDPKVKERATIVFRKFDQFSVRLNGLSTTINGSLAEVSGTVTVRGRERGRTDEFQESSQFEVSLKRLDEAWVVVRGENISPLSFPIVASEGTQLCP